MNRAWAAARALETGIDFAPDLVAAKPVKPCDGGVFGALDLLLKMKQNAFCAKGCARFSPGGLADKAASGFKNRFGAGP